MRGGGDGVELGMVSAGQHFRTEATLKVYTGRACWCLCKVYKWTFPVGEVAVPAPANRALPSSGAADAVSSSSSEPSISEKIFLRTTAGARGGRGRGARWRDVGPHVETSTLSKHPPVQSTP